MVDATFFRGFAAAAALLVWSVGLGRAGVIDEPKLVPRADVVRVSDDGTIETWRGRTVVATGGGLTSVDEEVLLDREGAMVRAFTRVTEDGEAPTSTWYDASRGTITVERLEGTSSFSAPTDGPWVYAPVVDRRGQAIRTPLGAWTTYRASARGAPVRVVRANNSALVPIDQLVVPTERGPAIIVDDDAAFVDSRFVMSFRGRSGRLVRVGSDTGDQFTFRQVEPARPTSPGLTAVRDR